MSEKIRANTKKDAASGQEVEVLYQRMGDRWFAFSLINDEVFVGSITPEELSEAEAAEKNGRGAKVFRKVGNS